MEKHHIIYRSQGGLDFELNYKYLTLEQHQGNDGPHLCKKANIKYKKDLQERLEKLLDKDFYNEHDLIEILGLKGQQAKKAFGKIQKYQEGMKREDIIRRLMGGRMY